MGEVFREMSERERRYYSRVVKKIISELQIYIQQLPCISFNGSHYDINLVKSELFRRLNLVHNDNFVIKKNANFVCICTPEFRFLDICQYMQPGVSYDRFLKAYHTDMVKGYFPYEWLDSVDKLDHPELPEYDSFYSSLKRCNTLNKEYLEYCKQPNDATQPPATGEENYAKLQEIWRSRGMTTFKDYLIYYNNLDVEPFIQAIRNMMAIYNKKGVDIFKEVISVSGIAKKLLFRSVSDEIKFSRFGEKNKSLHKLLRDNIVGGPSIIFHRHHEVDETFLRGNPDKPCKSIIGYDANALYLYCLTQQMPTGLGIVRRRVNNFKPDKHKDYKATASELANEWLRDSSNKEMGYVYRLLTEDPRSVLDLIYS